MHQIAPRLASLGGCPFILHISSLSTERLVLQLLISDKSRILRCDVGSESGKDSRVEFMKSKHEKGLRKREKTSMEWR